MGQCGESSGVWSRVQLESTDNPELSPAHLSAWREREMQRNTCLCGTSSSIIFKTLSNNTNGNAVTPRG